MLRSRGTQQLAGSPRGLQQLRSLTGGRQAMSAVCRRGQCDQLHAGEGNNLCKRWNEGQLSLQGPLEALQVGRRRASGHRCLAGCSFPTLSLCRGVIWCAHTAAELARSAPTVQAATHTGCEPRALGCRPGLLQRAWAAEPGVLAAAAGNPGDPVWAAVLPKRSVFTESQNVRGRKRPLWVI